MKHGTPTHSEEREFWEVPLIRGGGEELKWISCRKCNKLWRALSI